jgi:glycosyltransferase involved in cell wall biosynthesis
MRILFCNYEYPPMGGGGGVVNALLAQELAKHHDVTVLTSQALGLPSQGIEGGVRLVRTPVFFRKHEAVADVISMLAFLPMGVQTGKKLFRAGQYDIINTHFVLPTGPVGDALARFAKVPNVLSVHGGDLYDPSKWLSPHRHWGLRRWVRRLLRRADVVVGQSRNTLDNMRRFYTPELQGVQIPLGIRRPQPGTAVRSDYGCQESDVLLVTVGRLIARKGLHQLIGMMTALGDPKIRLLIVGTGPQEQLLKEEVSTRQLRGQVLFLGHVPEAEKFGILRMCDLYVSTSQHEGFGLVFLEAMACGLPVICYAHGGQTDFLHDQETGYLLPLNDADLFAERCKRLAESPELRHAMGACNRRRVEAYYIEHCAARYASLFERIVEAGRGGRNNSSLCP